MHEKVALAGNIGRFVGGAVMALLVLFLALVSYRGGAIWIALGLVVLFAVIVYFLNRIRKNPRKVKYTHEPW